MTIDDGFGNRWDKCERPDCDLQVVRPGKVQCNGCDTDDDAVADTFTITTQPDGSLVIAVDDWQGHFAFAVDAGMAEYMHRLIAVASAQGDEEAA